ncbi:hypothetical protein BJX76DRAFT_106583 [Aspergillus varians]
MSFDRVIQDSDDEEEPLGEISPEKRNRVPVASGGEQQGTKSPQAEEIGHDSHIGVNFDVFLQSQDAPQRTLSSSQQHREERWIPATGPDGSMGNTMTEIGFAQQRLFDDDQQDQFAHQHTVFHEPVPAQDVNYEMATQEYLLQVHDLPIAPAQDTFPRPELPAPDPSDDWSQSASYNIFDSSSHTPSGQLNRADFIRDSGVTIQTEPMQNFGLYRWASIQGAGVASSPHDTEPFSSVISPKAARAKCDNVALDIVQPSSASVDELSVPVTTEMPKLEKRGRKKQPVPVNDEDDELSRPEYSERPPSKPEKRKPGRPPKNPRVSLDNNNSGSVDLVEFPGVPPEENRETADSNALAIPVDDTTGNDVPLQSTVDEPTKDGQSELLTVPAPEQTLQLPPKPAKEPKKKKLKRGKTTSATLTKTYESDVEDDVIWIDERPIPTAHEDKTTSNPDERSRNTAAEQPPTPKKRGRKRKKTSEQLDQETIVPLAIGEPDARPPVTSEETNQPQQSDAHSKSGISVVLKNKTSKRTHTPDIANPIIEEDLPPPNPPQELQPPASTTNTSDHSPAQKPLETPQKPTDPKTPSTKGPGKHSPISSTGKVPYRVGLSKKARIAPLLKIVKR